MGLQLWEIPREKFRGTLIKAFLALEGLRKPEFNQCFLRKIVDEKLEKVDDIKLRIINECGCK